MSDAHSYPWTKGAQAGTRRYAPVRFVDAVTRSDRVYGTELDFAGGSFLRPDELGTLRYGSEKVNVYADATIPGGLGTFGYDDEGVPARRAPLSWAACWSGTSPTASTRDAWACPTWPPRGPTAGTAPRSCA